MTREEFVRNKIHALADMVEGNLKTILDLASGDERLLTLEQRERINMVRADMDDLQSYIEDIDTRETE